MVWNDDTTGNHEIYFKKSTDSGSTWGVIKRLNWMTDYSTRPVIAVDSTGNIYLVWNDHMPGNNEIYFKKSTDGGTTWAPPRRLTWNLDESSDPALVIDSNDDLHLFWSDESAGFSEIYYRISTDNGTTWSARQRLTYMPGYSYRPEAVVDSNDYLHLVWYDNTPAYTPDYNEEIYYKNRK
jgi:Neuraminidase (sialidase)